MVTLSESESDSSFRSSVEAAILPIHHQNYKIEILNLNLIYDFLIMNSVFAHL